MKKSNLIKVGDAIQEFLKQEKIDIRLSRFAVKNSWSEIAGKLVANNTLDISFHEEKLFLTLSSAALKQELEFNKQQLIDNINKFCGMRLICEIILK